MTNDPTYNHHAGLEGSFDLEVKPKAPEATSVTERICYTIAGLCFMAIMIAGTIWAVASILAALP